jgi:hypothetical protein
MSTKKSDLFDLKVISKLEPLEAQIKATLLAVRKRRMKFESGSQERKQLASVIICLEDALNMIRGRE